jgi:hypothetical protein
VRVITGGLLEAEWRDVFAAGSSFEARVSHDEQLQETSLKVRRAASRNAATWKMRDQGMEAGLLS